MRDVALFMRDLMLSEHIKPQFVVTGSTNAVFAHCLEASPVNGVDLGKAPHKLHTPDDSKDDDLVHTIKLLREHDLLVGTSHNKHLVADEEKQIVQRTRSLFPGGVSCARINLVCLYLAENPEWSVDNAVDQLINRIFAIYDRDFSWLLSAHPEIEKTLFDLAHARGKDLRGHWNNIVHRQELSDKSVVVSLQDPMLQIWLGMRKLKNGDRVSICQELAPTFLLCPLGEKLTNTVPLQFESAIQGLGTFGDQDEFWKQMSQISTDLANEKDSQWSAHEPEAFSHVGAIIYVRHFCSHDPDLDLKYHRRLGPVLLAFYGCGDNAKLYNFIRDAGEAFSQTLCYARKARK
jgi:hypothetical protein